MSVDLKRLVTAAADAALSDDRPAPQPPARERGGGGHGAFRGVRGVVAGAVLLAGARYAAKRAPSPLKLVTHLPKPDFDELTERARDLIDDWFPEEEPDDDYEGEEDDEDEDEDYEEPEGEDYDEPEGEAEADEEDLEEGDVDEEPDDEEDVEDEEDEEPEDDEADEPEAEADDEELEDDDEDEEDYTDLAPEERIDPASRPPKPPKRKKAKTG